jgi:hypothetical protein
MGEKIAKTSLRRDPGLRYYIHAGDIWAMPRAGSGHPGSEHKVMAVGLDPDHRRYFYYVDADGDVARRLRYGYGGGPAGRDEDAPGEDLSADVDEQLDEARRALSRVDALAALALEHFDGVDYRHDDPMRRDRVGHLVAATAEAAAAALAAYDRLQALLTSA